MKQRGRPLALHTCVLYLSQEIVSCEIKSLRQGAYCLVEHGFVSAETEYRLRSMQE